MLGDEREEELFEVWRDNWRTLEIFLRCGRSWDIVLGTGVACYQGIKPESVESVMRMSGVPRSDREAMLADLQVMESAALPILNTKP
jgi:hypothetical protein